MGALRKTMTQLEAYWKSIRSFDVRLFAELMLETIKEQVLDRPLWTRGTYGEYRITEYVSKGTYGMVYRAMHLPTKTHVILKCVRPSKRSMLKSWNWFAHEKNALLANPDLSHNRLLDTVRIRGQEALVLSEISGLTLDQWLDQKRVFSDQEILSIIKQLLDYATALHENGWVHRDLRLPNMIYEQDRLTILDLGLAHPIQEKPDYVVKTTHHPEKYELHPRSDWYSIGHVLIFLLQSQDPKRLDTHYGYWGLRWETFDFIERLLQWQRPYQDIRELKQYFQIINKKSKL